MPTIPTQWNIRKIVGAMAIIAVMEYCRGILELDRFEIRHLGWPYAALAICGLIIGLLSPALYIFIYRAGTIPTVSQKLRYLALVLAIMFGAIWFLPELSRWIVSLHAPPMQHFWSYNSPTAGGQVWNWIRSSWLLDILINLLNFSSEFAYILFLLAIFFHSTEPFDVEDKKRVQVFQIARIILWLSVLNVTREIIGFLVVLMMAHHRESVLSMHAAAVHKVYLKSAMSALRAICETLAMWIIYKAFSQFRRKEEPPQL